MAGYISGGMAVDYQDGEGSCKIGKRTYRWEFHEWGGPHFLRKDGNPLYLQPGETHPAWPEFDKWLKLYQKKHKKARASDVVKIDL